MTPKPKTEPKIKRGHKGFAIIIRKNAEIQG